jgi:hypothetical protein
MNFPLFLTTLWFIYFTAKIDYKHISSGQHITCHDDRFFQRLLFFIAVSAFSWELGIASALLFALLFDVVLNLFLQAPIFYLGNTTWWDRFFRKRDFLYAIMKLLLAAGSMYFFIYGEG